MHQSEDTTIEHARAFATRKFEQVNLANHFLEVYAIIRDEYGIEDVDILTAALLHDTLEDTETTYDELVKEFSEPVADYVEEVSHPKNYSGKQKDEYYEKLNHISDGAKWVKIGDFTSHLRKFIGAYDGSSDYPKMWDHQYVRWIQTFLEHIADSEAKDYVHSLTKQLDRLITENPIERPAGV